MVPVECMDNSVANATTLIRAAINELAWEQPGIYHFKVCSAEDPTSDVCDPGSDQMKSNTYSFLTVFGAQVISVCVCVCVCVFVFVFCFWP